MLIVMRQGCTDRETDRVLQRIAELGWSGHALVLGDRRVVGASTPEGVPDPTELEGLDGIDRVVPVEKPYTLASREARSERSRIRIGDTLVGGPAPVIIAGPCAVEDEAALADLAIELREHGADVLRAGAFKPRTSPYSFQGLGMRGLEILARVRDRCGLPVITEALDDESLAGALEFADILQVGARNMQNYALLRKAGRGGKPVFIKRGMTATMEDLLLAAEYVLSEGNPEVMVCERGIRTFSDHSRFTLDLSIVPALREVSHLPVFVDPSHGTGERTRVTAMALAAIAAGVDGVMVEVHADPARALSDGRQALLPAEFAELVTKIRELSTVLAPRGEVVP